MKSAMVGRWGGLGRSRALLSRLVRRHMAAGSMGSAGALLRQPMLELRRQWYSLSQARIFTGQCTVAKCLSVKLPIYISCAVGGPLTLKHLIASSSITLLLGCKSATQEDRTHDSGCMDLCTALYGCARQTLVCGGLSSIVSMLINIYEGCALAG